MHSHNAHSCSRPQHLALLCFWASWCQGMVAFTPDLRFPHHATCWAPATTVQLTQTENFSDTINALLVHRHAHRSTEGPFCRFIISFFEADGGVSIFEPPQPNTGLPTGKFLERRQLPRPGSSTQYAAVDFFVGAVITAVARWVARNNASSACGLACLRLSCRVPS